MTGVAVFEEVSERRGVLPELICVDTGLEFAGRSLGWKRASTVLRLPSAGPGSRQTRAPCVRHLLLSWFPRVFLPVLNWCHAKLGLEDLAQILLMCKTCGMCDMSNCHVSSTQKFAGPL